MAPVGGAGSTCMGMENIPSKESQPLLKKDSNLFKGILGLGNQGVATSACTPSVFINCCDQALIALASVAPSALATSAMESQNTPCLGNKVMDCMQKDFSGFDCINFPAFIGAGGIATSTSKEPTPIHFNGCIQEGDKTINAPGTPHLLVRMPSRLPPNATIGPSSLLLVLIAQGMFSPISLMLQF